MNLKDNLDKLPKWAQQEIKVLQMRLTEAKHELNRINENPVSDVFIGHETDIKDYPKPVYVKDYETISFRLPKGTIRARLEKDTVNISSSGEGEFLIKPNVSNSINIRLI